MEIARQGFEIQREKEWESETDRQTGRQTACTVTPTMFFSLWIGSILEIWHISYGIEPCQKTGSSRVTVPLSSFSAGKCSWDSIPSWLECSRYSTVDRAWKGLCLQSVIIEHNIWKSEMLALSCGSTSSVCVLVCSVFLQSGSYYSPVWPWSHSV